MKVGRSAHGLCTTWLEAQTIPTDVRAVVDAEPALRDLAPLLVVAEHQVPLSGGTAASQCDAWVLAKTPDGRLVSIGVEAKVDEPFGETIHDWLKEASPGKQRRLEELKGLLELHDIPRDVHYQLLHRAAAPIIEAKRFGAAMALLLVQSFDSADTGLGAYQSFLRVLGAEGARNSVTALGRRSGVDVYAAWVHTPSPRGYVPARPDLYSRRIDLAIRVAAVAHADDVRKDTQLPYISHPTHVARLLESDGWSEDVIVAGLLHDVMEDLNPASPPVQARFRTVFPELAEARNEGPAFKQAVQAFLIDQFGPDVIRLVLAVTEQKCDASGNERPWEERKREALQHLETADAEVLALKAADVLHNAQSIVLDLSSGQDVSRRFNAPPERTIWYYGSVAEIVSRRMPKCLSGMKSALPKALEAGVDSLGRALLRCGQVAKVEADTNTA